MGTTSTPEGVPNIDREMSYSTGTRLYTAPSALEICALDVPTPKEFFWPHPATIFVISGTTGTEFAYVTHVWHQTTFHVCTGGDSMEPILIQI